MPVYQYYSLGSVWIISFALAKLSQTRCWLRRWLRRRQRQRQAVASNLEVGWGLDWC